MDKWLGLGQRAVHERLQLSRSSGSFLLHSVSCAGLKSPFPTLLQVFFV